MLLIQAQEPGPLWGLSPVRLQSARVCVSQPQKGNQLYLHVVHSLPEVASRTYPILRLRVPLWYCPAFHNSVFRLEFQCSVFFKVLLHYVFVHVSVHIYVPWHTCGNQKSTYDSWFYFPPNEYWGFELRFQAQNQSPLPAQPYCQSHFFFFWFCLFTFETVLTTMLGINSNLLCSSPGLS